MSHVVLYDPRPADGAWRVRSWLAAWTGRLLALPRALMTAIQIRSASVRSTRWK
jgi:hypothetical protein